MLPAAYWIRMTVSDTLGLVVPTPVAGKQTIIGAAAGELKFYDVGVRRGNSLTMKLLESGTANPELAGPETDWLPAISLPLSRAWTETVVLALLPTALFCKRIRLNKGRRGR